MVSFIIWNYLYSDQGWLTFRAKVTWVDLKWLLLRTGSIWELVQENKVSFDCKKKIRCAPWFSSIWITIFQDGFWKLFLIIFKICKGTMNYSQQWSCVTVKDTDTCVLDQISTLPWVMKVFYICRNSCQLPLNKVCNFSHEENDTKSCH